MSLRYISNIISGRIPPPSIDYSLDAEMAGDADEVSQPKMWMAAIVLIAFTAVIVAVRQITPSASSFLVTAGSASGLLIITFLVLGTLGRQGLRYVPVRGATGSRNETKDESVTTGD
jgi:hypothetical protein